MRFFDDALGWIIVTSTVVVVVLIAWIFWSVWSDSQRPTFELKRDDWICTKSENHTRLQPTLAGKVTTLVPVTTTVCIEYTRRAIGGIRSRDDEERTETW